MPSEHQVELARPPTESLELLSREASDWGASWSRGGPTEGRLKLPVTAGLRHGWVEGPVVAEPSDTGARLTFREEENEYWLQRTSVTVLTFAAIGALVLVVAPFVPQLWPAIPLGLLMSVGAWLFIVARLRNSGPEEFFESLSREAERAGEE